MRQRRWGFTTTDLEKHDLWIDASTSLPFCWQDTSYQYFDVNVTSPYQGKIGLYLGQNEAGKPYALTCFGLGIHLGCKQTGNTSATIFCIPQDYTPACLSTASDPTMQCTPDVDLEVGQTVVDQHICTSTGIPIPEVITSADPLPAGLTYKRYPTDQSTWIVLNGTVGGNEYYAKTTFVAAHKVAATVNWHVTDPRPPEPASIHCVSRYPFYVGEVVHDEVICYPTGPVTMSGDPLPNGLTYTFKDSKYVPQVLLDGTVSEQARGSSGKTRFAVSPTVSAVYSWQVFKS